MKYSPNIVGEDSFFVHFSSIQDCNIFKSKYNGTTGHVCCKGKGIHIKTYNDNKVDNTNYDIIRKEYKTK